MSSTITSRITLKAPPAAVTAMQESAKSPVEVGEWMTLLVYGVSGIGKTRLCCSAADVPEMLPILVISCKGGLASAIEWSDRLTVMEPATWDEFLACVHIGRTAKPKFNTIVVDDAEAMYNDLLLASIMRQVILNDYERDEAVPSRREYGVALKIMSSLFDLFIKDTAAHVLFNLVDMTVSAGAHDLSTPVRPSLPGKASSLFCKSVSTAIYMKKDTARRPGDDETVEVTVGCTEATRVYFAKRRVPMPDRMINPTMRNIYDLWQEARTAQMKGGDEPKK